MVAYTYDSSIWEMETEGSQIKGQPELYKEMLSQNNK